MRYKMKHRLKRSIASQRGAVIATVIGALAATTIFGITVTAGVAIFSRQSGRDNKVKRALAASEAGTHEARYRMNMLQPTQSNPCVTESGGQYVLTPSPGPGQWCNEETVTLGSGNTATYQISPYVINNGVVTRKIVSTGTVNGVTRRVETTVSANSGTPLFGPFALVSDEELTMSGNANVTGSARSNEDIDMSGNARICGAQAAATPGPGHSVNLSGNATVCGSMEPASEELELTPPDQGDAPTNNDNIRLSNGQDPGSRFSWNASTRVLRLNANDTLNLGGHTYSLCKLLISGNGQLTIASGAEVRIFIDSTENCGYSENTTQLSVSGNGKIINTGQSPTNLQIYMMGKEGEEDEEPNGASFSGNALATEMTFYGPYTDVSISGNGSAFAGAFAAHRITMSGNGSAVTYDSSVETIQSNTTGVYQSQKFVECTSANPGGNPDSGC